MLISICCRYFGIQFYGECWSDEEAETRYAMHGEVDASHTEQNCVEGWNQTTVVLKNLTRGKNRTP